MPLTSAQIRYLLAVYAMQEEKGPVRITGLAQRLGVSKPSVHRMLGQLKELGMIEQDKRSVSKLTVKGMEIAGCFDAEYSVMLTFFENTLHMDAQNAKDAVAALLCSENGAVTELCRRMREFKS